MESHEVRHVTTKREKYYVCDKCNTSYPSKIMVMDNHKKIRVLIIEVNLRDVLK